MGEMRVAMHANNPDSWQPAIDEFERCVALLVTAVRDLVEP